LQAMRRPTLRGSGVFGGRGDGTALMSTGRSSGKPRRQCGDDLQPRDSILSRSLRRIVGEPNLGGIRSDESRRGPVEQVKGYHDITRYPDAHLIPGLVLFRWDAPLFFANAELFNERVLHAIANSPTPVRWLVVAAEPVTSVDVTAADAVCELADTLQGSDIELYFAEMKDPVKDKLKRFGLFARFGERIFFATVGEAVGAYLASHPVEWIDWEDRGPQRHS